MSKGPARVYLHIGLPKTGTTFLQSVLGAARETLREQGVLYPGRGGAHFLAAQDLTEHLFLGRENPKVPGAWNKLVRQSRRWSDTVVISHELFTHAEPSHIRRAIDDLAPAEVHVILTVRDFDRQLPAVWQERLKNGGKVSFERHFAQAVEYDAARPEQTLGFWRQQDAATFAARWAEAIPARQVHIITVPQRGAPKDLLWNRFAHVIGVDPNVVDLASVPTSGNVSLRPPQARLLRRVNQRLHGTLPPAIYRSVVKRYLSETPVDTTPATVAYALTPEQQTTASAWSKQLASAITEGGYSVMGDVSELIAPITSTESPAHAFDDVPEADESAAAVAVTSALIMWLSRSAEDVGPDSVGSVRGLPERLRSRG